MKETQNELKEIKQRKWLMQLLNQKNQGKAKS